MQSIPYRSFLGFASTALLALSLVACGDDESDNGDQAVDDAIAEGETLGQAQAAQTDTELGGEADPDVVAEKTGAILLTIDEGEILHADLALGAADDEGVLDYAQRMVSEHTQHAQQTTDLLAARDLAPLENEIAATLRRQALEMLDVLEASDDLDFDYTRTQLVMHSQALVIVDTLEGYAPDPELAGFLDQTRATIEDHRARAEELLRELAD